MIDMDNFMFMNISAIFWLLLSIFFILGATLPLSNPSLRQPGAKIESSGEQNVFNLNNTYANVLTDIPNM